MSLKWVFLGQQITKVVSVGIYCAMFLEAIGKTLDKNLSNESEYYSLEKEGMEFFKNTVSHCKIEIFLISLHFWVSNCVFGGNVTSSKMSLLYPILLLSCKF